MNIIIYAQLAAAIVLEVIGTLLLPLSQGFSKPLPTAGVAVAYLSSFYFLSIVVRVLPLAVVYATWSGLGVFLVAVFSYLLFSQTLNWQTILGLFLIVGGVTLVNTFSQSHPA